MQRSKQQDVMIGFPEGHAERKGIPIMTGVLDYFPAALAEVAKVSVAGNDQHNPGQPLTWSRGKSTDHANTAIRHLIERGTKDTDGIWHDAKAAWRALANLQELLERVAGFKTADVKLNPPRVMGVLAEELQIGDTILFNSYRSEGQINKVRVTRIDKMNYSGTYIHGAWLELNGKPRLDTGCWHVKDLFNLTLVIR